MNTQGQQFFYMRWFRIGVFAVLAVALVVGAAYWFGTGLLADSARSVAPSPIGSSLSNARESYVVAPSPLGSSLTAVRGSETSAAAMIASLAAASGSRLDDYYGRLTASSAAATSLAAASGSRLDDYYGRLTASSAAATSAKLEDLATR